ncbi:MAG TPA: cytochrome c oxidase assembly protein [Gaiellaceae bacterium]|nr:cytochrome c oxidase assembly protein [Gaiellaceae bacterium]
MLHVRSGYPGRAALLIGLVAIVAADVAPLDHRFSVHMAQHLVLGDLGPLCVVVGLRGRLRLAHPAVALPLWAASLVVWHLSGPYDAALRHVWLHQLQHLCFAAAGLAVWSAVLLEGPRWFTLVRRLPYVLVLWLVPLALSQVFIWSSHPFYRGYSLSDQRAGGGVMLVEGSVVMICVIVWLLLRILREAEAKQRLLEAG